MSSSLMVFILIINQLESSIEIFFLFLIQNWEETHEIVTLFEDLKMEKSRKWFIPITYACVGDQPSWENTQPRIFIQAQESQIGRVRFIS